AAACPEQPACHVHPCCPRHSESVEKAKHAAAMPEHAPPVPFGVQPCCRRHSVVVTKLAHAAAVPLQAPVAQPAAAPHCAADNELQGGGVPTHAVAPAALVPPGVAVLPPQAAAFAPSKSKRDLVHRAFVIIDSCSFLEKRESDLQQARQRPGAPLRFAER